MIPNRPMSDFAMRGEDIRNGFAKRFGGGFPFPGSSSISETFRNDTGDMVKKVVETDTKTINDLINNTLSERIQEDVKQDIPTYTRPNVTMAETQMSTDQAEQLFSSMIQDQESAKRYVSPAISEDSGFKNAAAALKTTEDATVNTIQNTGFDPARIQSILDAARNASGFTGLTGGISPLMLQTREDVIPLQEPQIAAPQPPPMPTPMPEPNISQQFDNLVGDVFGKPENVPEDYQLSKMDVTYTKVTPQPEEETLDSVIVSATKEEEKIQPDETLDSIDVSGTKDDSEPPMQEPRQPEVGAPMEQSDYRDEGPENPWEKFKRLYSEFYGADYGQVKSLISGKERKVTQEDLKPDKLYRINYGAAESKIVKDTNEIIRAQANKNDLRDFTTAMTDSQQNMNKQPIIVNNNNTVLGSNMQEPSTGRVFTDDNTFNRLSAFDAQHPQYSGFR